MEVLKQFLFGEINGIEDECKLIDALQDTTIDALMQIITDNKELIKPITAKVIPQFSNINDVDIVIRVINDSVDEISRQYIGYMINKNSSEAAQIKYGENHLKLAIMLGLVTENPYGVTKIGKEYMKLSEDHRQAIRAKLAMRIPLVQYLLVYSQEKVVDGTEYLKSILSEKTAIRRRSNAKTLIKCICQQASLDLRKQILNNIVWS